MVLYSIRQIFILCIWIYLWTLSLITLLSLTLGIFDKTLGIRKTLSRLFLKLFKVRWNDAHKFRLHDNVNLCIFSVDINKNRTKKKGTKIRP